MGMCACGSVSKLIISSFHGMCDVRVDFSAMAMLMLSIDLNLIQPFHSRCIHCYSIITLCKDGHLLAPPRSPSRPQ